ncbi:MAG: ChaN family lipoprotein [Bacteriovoracaceae bacterium]|jgi:uncharacterized iron-regulated protein|nr:ChaN family lipoprotein [Bacteriovoracaceae bacterium]
MKAMLALALTILSLNTFSATSIYKSGSSKFVTNEQFLKEIPANARVILGEYHYNHLIQGAQAQIIKDVVKATYSENSFTVGWEFLNYTAQSEIDHNFEMFSDDKIDLAKFFQGLSVSKNNLVYAPILKAVKDLGGQLLGLNIERSVKKKLITGGIKAVDPKYVPADFQLGDKNYRKRFNTVMGSHVPREKLDGYFLAQCFTDSVMSQALITNSTFDLQFVVAGSFHTDYFSGTVAQLKRDKSLPVITIKLIDTIGMGKKEIGELTNPSKEFGPIADYIFLL